MKKVLLQRNFEVAQKVYLPLALYTVNMLHIV
jgi:hypothetical protein